LRPLAPPAISRASNTVSTQSAREDRSVEAAGQGRRKVGRVPGNERLWVSAGYSGHGNVLGLACGELVAGAILGAPSPELELFDPTRLLGG
jgi:glycine/D-amino acid oxidase-like deaminating enzyme